MNLWANSSIISIFLKRKFRKYLMRSFKYLSHPCGYTFWIMNTLILLSSIWMTMIMRNILQCKKLLEMKIVRKPIERLIQSSIFLPFKKPLLVLIGNRRQWNRTSWAIRLYQIFKQGQDFSQKIETQMFIIALTSSIIFCVYRNNVILGL